MFSLVYFAQLLTIDAHFDRYVYCRCAGSRRPGRPRSLAPVRCVLLAVPLTWSVRDTRDLRKTDARVAAHRWIAGNLPSGALVAVDLAADLEGYRLIHLLPAAAG